MNNGFLHSQIERHRAALDAVVDQLPRLQALGRRICDSLERGGTVYTCGNGGSAADAQHLTGELIGRYRRERRPLRAVSLATDPSVISCIANDYSYDESFARQAQALCQPNDVIVGFTTSGRSASVTRALEVAGRRGARTVVFTGAGGQGLARWVDDAFVVADTDTARIQEMHVLFLHLLSDCIDQWAESGQVPLQ